MRTSERVGQFAPVPVCDQAICNRIERAETWRCWTFEQVRAWLRKRLVRWEDRSLAPFATQVVIADARTLDRMGRCVPWLRAVASSNPDVLGGQISALCDLRLQQWVRVQWWRDARDHCMKPVWTLIEHVQAATLLLVDRGYVSVALCDALTERGVWWISRYGKPVTSQIQPVCYQADGVLDAVVFLGTTRTNQATYPARFLQFCSHGTHSRSLTTVLDPQTLPLAEGVRWYARRWDIEWAFRAITALVNVHHLWSTKPAVIQVQRWCCLILAQVSHALQVEMAGEAGVTVFEVSLDVRLRFTPHWLAHGLSPLRHAVRVGRAIRLIRPHTRSHAQVPWIDPAWVASPPDEALQPRPPARDAGKRMEPPSWWEASLLAKPANDAVQTHRSKVAPPPKPHATGPRVCLKGGTLHVLE